MATRSLLLLPPIAALTAGCADEPGLPSPRLPGGALAPDYTTTALPSRDEVLRRWQLPASSPWAPYAKYTLITALGAQPQVAEVPDVAALPEVRAAGAAGRAVALQGMPADAMWVVDLRGPASVAFGVAISEAAPDRVSLVPTFNNWPAPGELVPAEETLAALCETSPAPAPDPAASDAAVTTIPVFMLDAWRLAYRDETPADDVYDNRYFLGEADLPDAGTLLARGVREVFYVVESRSDSPFEEDDLHDAFAAYERAGIRVFMVGLDELAAWPPEADVAGWDRLRAADALEVVPRVTIVAQPGFFVRSPGGFGGGPALPWWVRRGGGGGHGGGGGWHPHGAGGSHPHGVSAGHGFGHGAGG